MTRSTAHVARKPHRCVYGCAIPVGARYLAHVASPYHDDLGNTGWLREAECADHARLYGRAHLLSEHAAAPARGDGT